MKVAILKSQVFKQGGLEKYTLKMAEAFAKKQCEVIILTTDSEIPQKYKNSPLTFTPIAKTSSLSVKNLISFNRASQQWIKQNPVDLVFGMERTTEQTHYRAGSGVHSVFLKRRQLVDSRWRCFSFAINPLHYTLINYEKKCFENRHLKCLFTNSFMVKNEILENFNIDSKKLCVVHNGVEWEEMKDHFETDPKQAKQTLGLDLNSFQFLFIGNGYRRKGLHFLLKSLSQLKNESFQLNVVGKDKDLSSFISLSERLGIKNKINFFGPRKDIYRFYQASDTLVIPSIYDPFANVTIEALAMGLSVISSSYNGGSEIITPERGHVINNLLDIDALSSILRTVLLHPKTPQSALKIRESVKEFSFTHQLDKIITHSLNVIN